MRGFALLLRAAWRFHLRRPLELALCITGLALGVALVVAMDLAIDSARRGFALSADAVFGRTTHSLDAGPSGIDESVYVQIRTRFAALRAAPVVQGRVQLSQQTGVHLTLLGLDPFADTPFRGHAPHPGQGNGPALAALVTEPGSVLATAQTLADLGVQVGQSLRVVAAGGELQLRVAGTLSAADRLQRLGLSQVLVSDIATAQETLDSLGRLTRIDLIVPLDQQPVLEDLRARLPPQVRLERAAARSQAATQMTSAFYLSLRMLSLLALVVGVFIVYNTMTFAVVRRRALIGTLRAAGVTAREILGSVLCEGTGLSILGALLGIPLGIWLADELLGLVARSVDDLYFRTRVTSLFLTPTVILRGLLCAVGGGLIAALLPALEATRVPPRAAMLPTQLEQRLVRLGPRLGLMGLGFAAASVILVLASERSLNAAFAALFLLVLAGAALAPMAVLSIVAAANALLQERAGTLVLLAVRGLSRGMSRTAVAVAALAVALSATVAMAVMVDSFRESLRSWLSTTLEADLYVGIPGRSPRARFDEALAQKLQSLPGVAAVSLSTDRELAMDDGPLWLKAVSTDDARFRGLQMIAGSTAPWQALDEGRILVSEPLLARAQLSSSGSLELPTDRGPRRFSIAGVFRDYGSDRGMVLMSQRTLREVFDEHGYTGIGVHAQESVDLAELQARVRALVQPIAGAGVRGNAWIRDASMEIFDRTFLITRVMQWLATLVACVGVVSALMSLGLERRREFAILRAQGATRIQLLTSLQIHNGLLGLTAGLLALPLGIAMARVLVDVVNRRAFGWSMAFQLSPEILLGTLGLAVFAALLAGLYPAWAMSASMPASALRRG